MRFNIDIEDIKYLKITYQDAANNSCTVRAAIKVFDEDGIMACTFAGIETLPQIPQEVVLSLICPDGLYKPKTTLKSAKYSEPYVVFTLAPPQGLEREQNREYFRVPAGYDCIYTLNVDNKQLTFRAKTADISANGISLIIPEHVISNEECHLIININGIKIETDAKYIRSEKIDKGYRLSFTYTNISNQHRDFISRTCIHKQLEQKRRASS